MAMTSLKVASTQNRVSAEEWQTRVDLAASYRLAALYGMTDMIANHISAAVPGEPGHFLINPYGLLYTEITASSLLKIDLDGNILSKSDELDYGVNRAGFIIHSAIHEARHDVQCVMHTHTRAGMTISTLKCGLLPITQTATRFDKVAYHDFEGIAIDDAERVSLVRDLGDAEVMILRNHGLLVVGESVAEAFNTMYRLELACKVQVDAMACNTEMIIPPPDVVARAQAQWKPGVTRRYGILEWESMLRQLDRIDPTFRD
jgi:ribulose-5-phosphate 4-epimerase/fuculose-1-phosphate aldolase